ncbi:hypothetical protein B0H17DRAFT_928596, partial [Mycena rosella]
LSATLEVYEGILEKHKFLVGDGFTLVDLFHVAFGAPLASAGRDLMTSMGPNVACWWNDIITRPSWVGLESGIKSTAPNLRC